jgi:hypothetical protein
LRRHAKACWGEEAIVAADAVRDVAKARETLAKVKPDGLIIAAFERVGKGKVTYSHRQHTKTESRYIKHFSSHVVLLTLIAIEQKSSDGYVKVCSHSTSSKTVDFSV